MRIRLVKALDGVLDGLALSQFLPGYIYDVDESVGRQLVAMNAAIEVRSTDPALVTSDNDADGHVERLAGGIIVVPPHRAQDRPETRRRKRR